MSPSGFSPMYVCFFLFYFLQFPQITLCGHGVPMLFKGLQSTEIERVLPDYLYENSLTKIRQYHTQKENKVLKIINAEILNFNINQKLLKRPNISHMQMEFVLGMQAQLSIRKCIDIISHVNNERKNFFSSSPYMPRYNLLKFNIHP